MRQEGEIGMPFRGYAVVACGILARELAALRKEGFLNPDRLILLEPGLHSKPEQLKLQLTRELERVRSLTPRIIVAYGGERICHPEMQEIVKAFGARKVNAENCIDMLISSQDRERLVREAGGDVFWLSPGWLENWQRIYVKNLGWDKADANMNFPGFYSKAIFLDALDVFDTYPAEKILEFADWTGLVVESHKITLDRLRQLLLEAKG